MGVRKRLGRSARVAGIAMALALLAPSAASAVTIRPTTTADEFNSNPAACSLREAIEAASTDSAANADGCPAGSGADWVSLDGGGATYELTLPGSDNTNAAGDLDIRGGDLVLIAPQTGATIDANGATTGERAIEIVDQAPAIEVLIDNINIVDGGGLGMAADDGGGIALNAHRLILIDMALTGNRGVVGGGIAVGAQSTAELRDVTLSGNSATVDGGGLSSEGTVQMLNSTVTGNVANSDGDSIGGGGGLAPSLTGIQIQNTILAANSDAGQGANEPNCRGAPGLRSRGNNLAGPLDGCSLINAPGDRISIANPGLLPLAQNGGPAMTHALARNSPAIDRGANCSGDDSRDVPRIGPCDIGAYERTTCGRRLVNTVGSAGDDILRGTAGRDGIIGLGGSDRLLGRAGSDGVCGGTGKDILKGGKGADRLAGGAGKDRCRGGAGRDREKSC